MFYQDIKLIHVMFFWCFDRLLGSWIINEFLKLLLCPGIMVRWISKGLEHLSTSLLSPWINFELKIEWCNYYIYIHQLLLIEDNLNPTCPSVRVQISWLSVIFCFTLMVIIWLISTSLQLQFWPFTCLCKTAGLYFTFILTPGVTTGL